MNGFRASSQAVCSHAALKLSKIRPSSEDALGATLFIAQPPAPSVYGTGLSLMSPCKRTALTMPAADGRILGAYDVTQRHAHHRAILKSVDFEEPSVSGLG